MSKYKRLIPQIGLLFIITVPTFYSLFNTSWFSVHDDQHIARLFLLDTAIKQGILYPRWVDTLGFGFGYPLFNFYPPLIYYFAEAFHIIGYSLITSLKLMIVGGYFLATVGMYFLAKKYIGKAAGLVSAVFYTYFTYHAVVVYVRGAFAEFFTMAILPFIFLSIHNLSYKPNKKNATVFGILFAILIVTHPLIALPTVFFIGFFFLFYFFGLQKADLIKAGVSRMISLKYFILVIMISLSLSAFFWLPSLFEKKYTLAESILTGELANYKLHFIYPQQLWYSPWGYGGSAQGLDDGISFQLGKIHIIFTIASLILFFIYRNALNHKSNQPPNPITFYPLFIFLLLFSLFMSTPFSSRIWDTLSPMWYIQFPWRFHTFSAVFISICCGYFLFFLTHLFNKLNTTKILSFLAFGMSFLPIIFYQKYFFPQHIINTNDAKRTTYEEIAWNVSRSSYDFVPKGVVTTKTELGTTVVDIKKDDLPASPYNILNGSADVIFLKNNYDEKIFQIDAKTEIIFQLNTYNFPGWRAFSTPIIEIKTKQSQNKDDLLILDSNPYKLITVSIPEGQYKVVFKFQDTSVRRIGNYISVVTILILLFVVFKNHFVSLTK